MERKCRTTGLFETIYLLNPNSPNGKPTVELSLSESTYKYVVDASVSIDNPTNLEERTLLVPSSNGKALLGIDEMLSQLSNETGASVCFDFANPNLDIITTVGGKWKRPKTYTEVEEENKRRNIEEIVGSTTGYWVKDYFGNGKKFSNFLVKDMLLVWYRYNKDIRYLYY